MPLDTQLLGNRKIFAADMGNIVKPYNSNNMITAYNDAAGRLHLISLNLVLEILAEKHLQRVFINGQIRLLRLQT
jgi:hypothetical protein